MGIFGALTTAVTGLRAQAFALENISGNIANSQTPGFKRVDTSFADMVGDNPPIRQTSGAVGSRSNGTNTVQGSIQNSSVDTFMAVNGDGYFVVQRPTGFVDGRPIFAGTDMYTRRGDFKLDNAGYLVNGTGYYLKSLTVDRVTGNVTGSVPQTMRFNNDFLPAEMTENVDYRANLASFPITSTSNVNTPRSELLRPAGFTTDPRGVAGPAAVTGTGSTLLADAPAVRTGTTSLATLSSAGGTLVLNGTNITIAPGANAAAVEAAIDAATGTTGVSAAISASNQLVLTSANADTNITVGAGTTAGLFSELGLSATTTNSTNLINQGTVTAGQTLTVQLGTNPAQTITFGTGVGQVSTLAELNTALGAVSNATASVNTATGNISITATGTTNGITLGGTANWSRFGVADLISAPKSGYVIASEASTFVEQSISGGALTVYDVNGAAANLQFRWAKVDSSTYGGTNKWNLFYMENSTATGSQVKWRNTGVDYTFGTNGQLSPAIPTTTLSGLTIDGVSVGNVTLNHGTDGLTQFADANGNASVTQLAQDGFAAGQMIDISVSDRGRIVAAYSNGRTAELATIPLVSFTSDDNLKRKDGGAFEATQESGAPLSSTAGKVLGGSMEDSNTDISEEFTKLIVTQQAYAANTRIVSTSNQMMQETINMIR